MDLTVQQNLFGDENEYRLERTLSSESMVKTTSYSQDKILSWIIRLHCPRGFDLDPTYSKGNFYKVIPEPKIKMDLNPGPGIISADVRALPLKNSCLETIIFDPPFVGGTPVQPTKPRSNIIHSRFGSYRSLEDLWIMYKQALEEFYRVLNGRGVLVVKCQDTISSRKQYLSHVEIINYALQLGFYAKDLFVLLSGPVLISGKWKNQEHARKTHCYFLVFSKKGRKVSYSACR